MATVEIATIRDGGHVPSTWRPVRYGSTGQFQQRIRVHRLGRARQFVFVIRCTDPVSADIIAASVRAER